jgi:RND family efflux transporter MFP subunit
MIHRQGKLFSGFRPFVWALLLTISMSLAACGDKTTFTPPPPPQVTVSQPVKRQVTDALEFTGNTQAINTVQLRARVEGYLDKVLFHDGDRVQKGQLLFLIQQNTYQAKLQQANAEILAQKARLFHAQTELDRYSKLVREKAASQTDVDQWLYERDASKAALVAAEAKRDLAKLDLEYTQVTAPFTGRIDRRLKDPGNLVGSGESTVLAEINQIDPIYVYFTMNERDLLRLMGETREPPEQASKEKRPVFLGLANEKGYPHQGHLDFAAIGVAPTTGTLLLRGIFPNTDGMILPGLFARVRAPGVRERSALLVPQVAIGFDQQGSYVMVVKDDQVVERRSVTLGPQVDTLRVIEDGLKEGDWVVVNGLLRAIPGRKVNPQKEEPRASQGLENGAPKTPAPGKADS